MSPTPDVPRYAVTFTATANLMITSKDTRTPEQDAFEPQRPSHSSSAIALASGRLGAGLLSLVSAMVLSRLLSQQQYGTYQQVWLVYNTLLPFVLFGLPSSIIYYVPQADARGQKMIVVQTWALLLVAGLAIGAAAYALSGPLSVGFRGNDLRVLLRAFFFFPIFTLPLTFVDSLLVAIGRARVAGWFNIFSGVMLFGAVTVPIALGCSLLTVMYTLSISAGLRFAVTAFYVLREYADVPLQLDRAFVTRQLRYSIPLGVASLLGTLTLQLNRIMIASMFGPREYAIYVNGATELPFVAIISGSVMSVVTPEFVRLYRDRRTGEILRLWHSATRKVALVFFPLTALLMAFGADFVVLLFSARYSQSASLFRIFLLLLPLRITVYGSLLMAAGLSTLVLRAAVATLAFNVVLNFTLIPLLGLEGAALSTVIATYFMGGWQLVRCARLLEVPFGAIFPWPGLARLLAASTIAAGAAWLAAHSLPTGGIRFAIGTTLFIAFAVPLFYYAGARPEMMAMLRRRR